MKPSFGYSLTLPFESLQITFSYYVYIGNENSKERLDHMNGLNFEISAETRVKYSYTVFSVSNSSVSFWCGIPAEIPGNYLYGAHATREDAHVVYIIRETAVGVINFRVVFIFHGRGGMCFFEVKSEVCTQEVCIDVVHNFNEPFRSFPRFSTNQSYSQLVCVYIYMHVICIYDGSCGDDDWLSMVKGEDKV